MRKLDRLSLHYSNSTILLTAELSAHSAEHQQLVLPFELCDQHIGLRAVVQTEESIHMISGR